MEEQECQTTHWNKIPVKRWLDKMIFRKIDLNEIKSKYNDMINVNHNVTLQHVYT